MVMETYLAPIAGGALVGLSASLLLLFNGRIAGISGIVGGILRRPGERFGHDIAFVIGLLLGPLSYILLFDRPPEVQIVAAWPVLILAGLLVGFGSRMGSGCTSGHGISGLARLSPRSFVAVLTFVATAILTVLAMRIGGFL